ncbi:hypothetical protein ACJMK2_005662 [Sinanodonta woodiana]|uniref:Uncharacterized protein n=1 Tax=Sinanodonta woodiana TaxID=1069815 RepID=A0ABD3VR65_SINWO
MREDTGQDISGHRNEAGHVIRRQKDTQTWRWQLTERQCRRWSWPRYQKTEKHIDLALASNRETMQEMELASLSEDRKTHTDLALAANREIMQEMELASLSEDRKTHTDLALAANRETMQEMELASLSEDRNTHTDLALAANRETMQEMELTML